MGSDISSTDDKDRIGIRHYDLMNILHTFCANFFSGAVAYALHLAKSQSQENHNVYLASNPEVTSHTTLPFFDVPVYKRSFLNRIKNIISLRKIIKEQQIDIVHAHSRAASWVAYWATIGTQAALVSTIHGRQKKHNSQKNRVYGEKIIAVCQNLEKHLIEEIGIPASKISLIPNLFFSEETAYQDTKNTPRKFRILYITRFNLGKGKRVYELLTNVFDDILANNECILSLVGGTEDEMDESTKIVFQKLSEQYPDKIEILGFVRHLKPLMHTADLIMGGGRVAIQALVEQKPVVALGDVNFEGLVTLQNIERVIASNYGDMVPFEDEHKAWDFLQIRQHLEAFIKAPNVLSKSEQVFISKKLKKLYDYKEVTRRIMEVYISARMKKLFPEHIPALMYHKVPDENIDSKHKIYISKDNFKLHLDFLKKKNFTPITVSFYEQIAKGERKVSEMPPKPIFLTFDDGYLDNFTNVLPLMESYQFVGNIFLLGDVDIRYNFWDADLGDHKDWLMTNEQKKAFVEAGWEIGVHTLTHPDLTTISIEEAWNQLTVSKKNLEDLTGKTLISFAYPYGRLNAQIKQLVRDAGFLYAFATDSGGLHLEDDRLHIFRVNIFPEDKTIQLVKKTATWYRQYYYRKRRK